MKRAHWILAALAMIAFIPAIYLFSLGPATALASRHVISDEAYDAYFAPIPICFEGMSEDHWFARGLMGYVRLWVPPGDESAVYSDE